jgi:hypothetical protein
LAAATVAASPQQQQRPRPPPSIVPVVRSGGERFFDAAATSAGAAASAPSSARTTEYAPCSSGDDGYDDDETITEEDDDFTPSSSGYTDDLIDEILENYRFTFQPEVRVKLRRRLPGVGGGGGGGLGGSTSAASPPTGPAMCVCYSKPWQKEPRWRFTLKPGKHGWVGGGNGGGGRRLALSASDREDDDGEEGAAAARRAPSTPTQKDKNALATLERLASTHVRKLLVVPSLSSAMIFTNKVPVLGVLRLQFAAGYNWRRKAPMLEYRLTTKWGADTTGRLVRRKEEYQLSPACLLRAKWHLDAHFPDMEGHLGAAGAGGGAEGEGAGGGGGAAAIDVDYGGMHFEVSQLDVVLDF